MADETKPAPSLITLAAEIVMNHVGNNHVPTSEVPGLITTVYDSLSKLGSEPAAATPAKPQGAVGIRKSLASPDHIISMIDGKPYKMLRRHLTTNGHTEQSYRETYGLPKDYPMVAASYAAARRELAKSIGLGRKAGATVAKRVGGAVKKVAKVVAPIAKAETPAKPGRKPRAISGAAALAKVRAGS